MNIFEDFIVSVEDYSYSNRQKLWDIDTSLQITGYGNYYAKQDYFTTREGYNNYLVIYTCSGDGQLVYNSRIYQLKPNSLVIFDCRKLQDYSTLNEIWHFKWTHIQGKTLEQYFDKFIPSGIFYKLNVNNYIESVLDKIYNVEQDNIEANIAHMEYNILAFELLKEIHNLRINKSKQNRAKTVIDKANYYMQKNFNQDIDVDKIAQYCNLSKFYFINYYKKITGITPHAKLIEIRLAKAYQMLLTTDLPIEEIAYNCGYSNSSNLIRAYKNRYSMTPLDFRKMLVAKKI